MRFMGMKLGIAALALAGFSASASATPFTFEFDLPNWSESTSQALFGTNPIMDVTVDNGSSSDANQNYLNSQITQVEIKGNGGSFDFTWNTLIDGGAYSYISTDAGGTATLDLAAVASWTNETAAHFSDDSLALQLGVLSSQYGGPDTVAIYNGSFSEFAFDVPYANGGYTGIDVTGGLAPGSSQVPEPFSVFLVGIGLAALGVTRKTR